VLAWQVLVRHVLAWLRAGPAAAQPDKTQGFSGFLASRTVAPAPQRARQPGARIAGHYKNTGFLK